MGYDDCVLVDLKIRFCPLNKQDEIETADGASVVCFVHPPHLPALILESQMPRIWLF